MSIHHHYIQRWEARYDYLARVEAAYTSYEYNHPYMVWHRSITRLFLTPHGSSWEIVVIHEADRLVIPPNVVDTERQSSDEEVRIRSGGVRTKGGGVWIRGGGVRSRGGGVRTRRSKIHEADEFLIPPNVVDAERQSSDEEVGMTDIGVRTRGRGVRTRGRGVHPTGGGVHTRSEGVRTRGGGVRTRGGHIYDDPHFHSDDASVHFPSSTLQHSSFNFSTPLNQSLPYSSARSIAEGVIQEDVGTSFMQEILHSYIDGLSFHIPMSSSIDVSFTPPTAPLIALSPQSLGHPFRDDVAIQMQYFPSPLVEQQREAQV
ncbi:hypothetical protein CK203_033578 [Vitis vinifera]|uniref:Serine/threonine-protein phosphatase 7 long form-like n=1 Tax=Vitis vinifera TaxID=29760 RepID=A0A438FLJ2_VITVI|nr:hypothetical protein CK203_033578 [Vitis vinifera]